eukprot:scpid60001/ scgid34663/ 
MPPEIDCSNSTVAHLTQIVRQNSKGESRQTSTVKQQQDCSLRTFVIDTEHVGFTHCHVLFPVKILLPARRGEISPTPLIARSAGGRFPRRCSRWTTTHLAKQSLSMKTVHAEVVTVYRLKTILNEHTPLKSASTIVTSKNVRLLIWPSK